MWYEAPSSYITVFYLHWGLIMSSFFIKKIINILKDSLLVFPWLIVKYKRPLLLIAAIRLIRELTIELGRELVVTLNLHFLRLKSVYETHVSSMLITSKSWSNTSIIYLANSCRNTRFLSEFPENGIFFIFLFFICNFFFNTYLIK